MRRFTWPRWLSESATESTVGSHFGMGGGRGMGQGGGRGAGAGCSADQKTDWNESFAVMIFSIASGKGGTGKTTVATNLARSVCVNKFDLNPDLTADLEAFVKEEELTYLGHIPFDPAFTEAMVLGQTIFESNSNSKAGPAISQIWERLLSRLGL